MAAAPPQGPSAKPAQASTVTAEEITRIDREVRAKFTFVDHSDALIDSWTSHRDDVMGSRPWTGNCEDLASTVLDMLGRAGVPRDQRFRLLVSAAKDDKIDHMVGVVVDNAGAYWVVGDAFSPAYAVKSLYHQPMAYNRLDETGVQNDPVWRTGVPWEPWGSRARGTL